MLPGLAGLAGRSKRAVPVTTILLKASGSVVVPPDILLARITCIGRGGFTNANTGGGGGALSQSVISLTPGETLTAYLSDDTIFTLAPTYVARAGITLVQAENGAKSGPSGATVPGGLAANGIGSVRHSGGSGTGSANYGGGAAGTDGDGASGSTGGARGPGMTFVAGEAATNGAGGGFNQVGGSYGGGAGNNNQGTLLGGPGLVVIEWGFGQ